MRDLFMEQYSEIQAAALEPRLWEAMTKESVDRLKDKDFRKTETFV